MAIIQLVEGAMRTNIDIDQALLDEAMALGGLTTKRAVVEEALRRMVQTQRRARALHELADLGWDGNLEEMREGRLNNPP